MWFLLKLSLLKKFVVTLEFCVADTLLFYNAAFESTFGCSESSLDLFDAEIGFVKLNKIFGC